MGSRMTKKIIDIVKNYSEKKNISISEFGRRAGVSKAWLSRLQNTDANLSVETASRLLNSAGYELQIVKKSGTTANEYKSRLKKVAKWRNM